MLFATFGKTLAKVRNILANLVVTCILWALARSEYSSHSSFSAVDQSTCWMKASTWRFQFCLSWARLFHAAVCQYVSISSLHLFIGLPLLLLPSIGLHSVILCSPPYCLSFWKCDQPLSIFLLWLFLRFLWILFWLLIHAFAFPVFPIYSKHSTRSIFLWDAAITSFHSLCHVPCFHIRISLREVHIGHEAFCWGYWEYYSWLAPCSCYRHSSLLGFS